jgi:hypothetical protein
MSCSKLFREDELPQRKRARVIHTISLTDLPVEILAMIMKMVIIDIFDYWKFTMPPRSMLTYHADRIKLRWGRRLNKKFDNCVGNSLLSSIVRYLFKENVESAKAIWDSAVKSISEITSIYESLLNIESALELMANCPCGNCLLSSGAKPVLNSPAKDRDIFDQYFPRVVYGFCAKFCCLQERSLRLHCFIEIKRAMIYSRGDFRYVAVPPLTRHNLDITVVTHMDPLPTIFASCDGIRYGKCTNGSRHIGAYLFPLPSNVSHIESGSLYDFDSAFFTGFFLWTCDRCKSIFKFCTKVELRERKIVAISRNHRVRKKVIVAKYLCMDCLTKVSHTHVEFNNFFK